VADPLDQIFDAKKSSGLPALLEPLFDKYSL
jgi:hypothetical protein